MKRLARWVGAAAFVLLAGAEGQSCCNPPAAGIPRTTNDGSAKWAIDIAAPAMQACAADADVRQIFGARVGLNGRLFTNVGTWSVVGFSRSTNTTCQITVRFDGTTTTSKRTDDGPDGPGIQKTPPALAFVDSTDVFANLASKFPAGKSEATLVVFNVGDYGGDQAGKAVWGVNVGDAFFVAADGTVLP